MHSTCGEGQQSAAVSSKACTEGCGWHRCQRALYYSFSAASLTGLVPVEHKYKAQALALHKPISAALWQRVRRSPPVAETTFMCWVQS